MNNLQRTRRRVALPNLEELMQFRKDGLSFMVKQRDKDDHVTLQFGLRQQLHILNHPDLVRDVLVVKQPSFKKGVVYDILRQITGGGLLTDPDPKHQRRQRVMMQPYFHMHQIGQYADKMVECAVQEVSTWQDGEERMINEDMMGITLSVITATMFGTELNQNLSGISEALHAAHRYILKRSFSLAKVPAFLPTKLNREFKAAIRVLDHAIYTILESRRNQTAEGQRDLLSTLMAARDEETGEGMSDQEIRDQVMTLFTAGHETTAHTLEWAWYLLSQHPEVYQKFLDEVDTVLQGRLPTVADAKHLVYTHHLLLETMRLYPALWVLGRDALEDVELSNGRTVPSGDMVLLSPYSIHRDPRLFDDPDVFLPERFEGDLLKRIHPYAYFPFGAGPRICIGQHFALMEMVMVMATISQRYTVELAEGYTLEPEALLSLRPKNGLKMRVKRR